MATVAEQRGQKKPAKSEEAPPAEANGNGAQPEEARYLEHQDLSESAEQIRKQQNYQGVMTGSLLRALEELLYSPIPPRFIEETPPGDGHPFPMTGIKSVQVQLDRLTAVLGMEHYRVLLHYRDNGVICKSMVVVGNDLQWCRLDEQGQLIPFTVLAPGTESKQAIVKEAEVLKVVEGMGGWKRGTNPGDTWKGAETNGLKRVIARLGPGAEVYSQDFEDNPRMPEYRPTAADTVGTPEGTQVQEPGISDEEGETLLAALLAEDHPLKELRAEANALMEGMPEPPPPALRYHIIKPRSEDENGLKELVTRAKNATPAEADEPAPEGDASGV